MQHVYLQQDCFSPRAVGIKGERGEERESKVQREEYRVLVPVLSPAQRETLGTSLLSSGPQVLKEFKQMQFYYFKSHISKWSVVRGTLKTAHIND